MLPDGVRSKRGYENLARAHVVGEEDLPPLAAALYGVAGCRWCQRAYRSARGPRGRSSLSAHEALCRGNPRSQRSRAAAAPAAARGAAPADDAADAADLFAADYSASVAARSAFLQRVAPADAGWAPMVASGARTAKHMPSALLEAWRVLAVDALDWVRREPEHARALLWPLLLPSLLLHSPARAPADELDRPRPPLMHAERAAVVLRGDLIAARRPGWRRPVGETPAVVRRAGQRAAKPSSSQHRALRLSREGRLSAAARALRAQPLALQTSAIWDKARGLFPPALSASATTTTVEAEFVENAVGIGVGGPR